MQIHLGPRLLLTVAIFLSSNSMTAETRGAEPAESSGSDDAVAARAECLSAHTRAQELKKQSKFVEANEFLSICSGAVCPGAIIEDCATWMSDLETITPSMVFQVHVDGKEAPLAKIEVDGKVVEDEDKVSGVQVDPGLHKVTATLPDRAPMTQSINLPAGQRMRLVSFEFEDERPMAADAGVIPQEDVSRPVPVAVYPLVGVGVVGLAGFGVLASLSKAEQNDLGKRCSPDCSDDDLSKMKTMYLIGDISAAVGVAALITAGVVYLARPKRRESAPPVSLMVAPTPQSLGLIASGTF